MRTLPRYSPTSALLLAIPGVVLAVWGVLFAAGGLAPGSASLIAAGTTIPAAVALGLVGSGRWPFAPPSRSALIAAAGLICFALVAALSSTWSLSAARSRDDATLAAGYVGALTLGVLLGPLLRRPGVVFATGITSLATIASASALVARSFPSLTGVQFTPRLSGTLSLPNAMAALALTGLFGGLALAAHRDRRLRAVGGAVAAVNMLALVLTSSRSGLGLALVGIIALLLVLPASPRMRLIGLIAVLPAVGIGTRIATWSSFVDTTKSVAAAGWGLVIAAIAVGLLGAALAVLAPKVLLGADPEGKRGRASRRTLLIAAITVSVLFLALVARAGGPVGAADAIRAGFSSPVGQSGVRIGLGANLRDHWWQTAADGFADKPITGWGAGTFRLLEQTTRNPAYTTDSAHNTVLEAFAGTGLIGGVPFIVGGIALVVIAVGGIRRARVGDDTGATVTAIGAITFISQGMVDVDWDLAAQGVLAYAAIGAIAPCVNRVVRVGMPSRALAIGLSVALLSAGLLGIPSWLGARNAELSSKLLGQNPQVALNLATSAHRYDPISVAPLIAEAEARAELGDITGAQAALLAAITQEPQNYEPWLAEGTFLSFAWGQPLAGRAALERALRLSGGDSSVQGIIDSLPATG